MASRETLFDFRMNMTGQQRVSKMFDVAQAATGALLGKKLITKKILKMNQDRLAPAGSNDRAQKSPDGEDWARPTDTTMRRRHKNTNANQALVDKGNLKKAILIARDGLKTALRVGTGTADIGVRHRQNRRYTKEGKVEVKYTDEYGYYHQNGIGVPQREFLGVGKQDAKEIEDLMVQTMNKFFGAFS